MYIIYTLAAKARNPIGQCGRALLVRGQDLLEIIAFGGTWLDIGAKSPLGTILNKIPVLRAKEYGELGISRLKKSAHGHDDLYSAAKTVVDCFKFRSRVGQDVAVEALRDFLKKNRGQSDRIWRLARKARVRNIMLPYMESLRWRKSH